MDDLELLTQQVNKAFVQAREQAIQDLRNRPECRKTFISLTICCQNAITNQLLNHVDVNHMLNRPIEFNSELKT